MTRLGRVRSLLLGLSLALTAAGPIQAEDDDELRKHLTTLKNQVDDQSLSIGQRERLALEMAATLDRAAEAAPSNDIRRERWTEAIALLDRFHRENPSHPLGREFQLQAAVYLWARGMSWAGQWEMAPTEAQARDRAAADLDSAIQRLRALNRELGSAESAVAQNARFRLAAALNDRCALEPEGSKDRRGLEMEALGVLGATFKEPGLLGFVHLLRAEVLNRLDRAEQAETELQAAARSDPAPPLDQTLRTRVAILSGRRRFDQALKAVSAAKVDDATKDLFTIRIRLAQRAALPEGPVRREVEAVLFARVKTLQATGKPQARRALLALAGGLEKPGSDQGPGAWEVLAEGAMLRGELRRASALDSRAAELAETQDEPERAAAARLRAGALLFQAGQYSDADAMLTRVFDDPKAGTSRPKAGLLRALTRGRALAQGRRGFVADDYTKALEDLVRSFPTDDASNEARWLLGRIRLAASRREEALKLWEAIPHGAPRWLDARLAATAVQRDDLANQRLNNDRDELARRFKEAHRRLEDTLAKAQGMVERTEVELALARLDLTPGPGAPDEARSLCERIVRVASQADQRDRAARLLTVALVQLHRFVEAEQQARALLSQTRPVDLLETARLLDHTAADSESDLRTRRSGLILEILLDRALDDPAALGPGLVAEARLRRTRALLFAGDDRRARESVARWGQLPASPGDPFLRDLADTYLRLDDFERAADVERLRAQRLATGSLPWFDARYGLALAYYRAGKADQARRLIDATSILHPDLGGGELQGKFIRLRQRLLPDGNG